MRRMEAIIRKARLVVERLPILGETAAAAQPSQRSFHHPAFRQDDEAFGLIRAFDDLPFHPRQDGSHGGAELGSLIAAIGVELEQEGIEAELRGQQHSPAVAVLDIGCSDDLMQHLTLGIDQDVPLLAFDLLASVIAMRIDVGAALFGAFDALGIDDRCGRTGLTRGSLAAFDAEGIVLRAARSLGIARHWQPVLRMYIRPLTTSRRLTVRLLPPGLAGGIKGAISAHSSSARSLS